ncbi:M3 family peptidase [Parabacteroides sp. AM58-2XD]|uniref:M3 family metallopeptidase n=1 Tax=Parabacteroides TaxID=375288 RepID=UPI000FE23439|nr:MULTISPECIES: M3 family metallopeptidase [Parabacteroides]MCM0721457.1 M3 family metallopeptidase [Parabacteroides sp. W1-Q-101]RGZ00255.1 M3 family peptidase [Parabacteroides sp. AM58-2XD]
MKKMIMTAGIAVALSACSSPEKKSEILAPGDILLTEFTTPFGVPPFDKIELDDYMPAFKEAIAQQQKEVDDIVGQTAAPDFENTIVALDQSGNLLRKVNAVFSGLNSANTNDEMQALSRELSPLLSKNSDDIRLNKDLFARVKTVYDNRESLNLNKEQKKLLEETYKSFVRGGANLDAEQQARLRELNSEISMLQLTFGQNMLKETNAFQLVIENKDDLAGLPESLILNAEVAARAAGLEGKWLFTLHNPSVMPFLQYADNRALREKIFKGYINRGNNGNDADNKDVVLKLVTLRLEKAKLMGYDDYASFVLEDRMAKTSDKVYALLDEIWKPALVKAKEELADINAEIKKEGGNFEAEGWDWRYYFEKAKKAKFDLDENQVRPYLKLENVRDGAFLLANKLYGITFTPIKEIPLPHPDAQAFECKDKNGTHLGVLYMDFFPRASKRGGAWCGTYRSQTYKDGKRQGPVVTIVCNFSQPAPGQPALLSADEAETLFHEFGHGLHNLFKDVHYYGVSGVPRDFVELPSQVMEHWVFEPELLKEYAKHYETNEVIPAELIEKLDKSGKYGQGFATTEYLAASLLDMDFHVLKEVHEGADVMKFEETVLGERGLLKQIPSRYRTTYFNHTMGGGYTAGYYSYIWAEVLDADAYQAYKETGDIFNQEVATKFREYVLTPGGIDDAMDMYKNFRGKEPNTEPLLKNRGLK